PRNTPATSSTTAARAPPNATMNYTQLANGARQAVARKPWLKGVLIGGGALAAVVLLVAGVFLGRWWFTPSKPAAMAETITFGSGGTMSASQFKMSGQKCGDNFLEPTVTVNYTECDKDHRVEFFAIGNPFSSSGKHAYPGDEWLRAYAENFCTLHFMSDVVQLDDKEDKLNYAAVIPTRGEWQEDPKDSELTREVSCVLWSRDKAELSSRVTAE
ncbi:serine/threonine protein kinase, partial [Saccharothrix longispora]|nr:serine/threonine protein kinase [Saccharothrix longispora]